MFFFQIPPIETSPQAIGSGRWKIVVDTTQDVNGETSVFRSVFTRSLWFKPWYPFSVMKTSVSSFRIFGDVQISFIRRYSAIRWGRPTCCEWSGPPRNGNIIDNEATMLPNILHKRKLRSTIDKINWISFAEPWMQTFTTLRYAGVLTSSKMSCFVMCVISSQGKKHTRNCAWALTSP